MSLFILVFKRCCHQIQTSQLTAVFETCHVSSSLCHVPDENSAFVGSARPLAVNQLFFLVSFKDFCSVLGLKTSIMVNLAIDFWGLICFGSLPRLINTGNNRDRSFQISSLYYFNCYYEYSFYFINYFLYFLKLCYNYIIGSFPFLPQRLLHITPRFLSKS